MVYFTCLICCEAVEIDACLLCSFSSYLWYEIHQCKMGEERVRQSICKNVGREFLDGTFHYNSVAYVLLNRVWIRALGIIILDLILSSFFKQSSDLLKVGLLLLKSKHTFWIPHFQHIRFIFIWDCCSCCQIKAFFLHWWFV